MELPVRRVIRLQAIYYLITGIWPLLNIRSFEAISGPKIDDWLVKTVAALIASIGGVLFRAGRTGRPVSDDALVAATASAVSLAAVDVWYAGTGRIWKIYLADALPEVAFAVIAAGELRRRGAPQPG